MQSRERTGSARGAVENGRPGKDWILVPAAAESLFDADVVHRKRYFVSILIICTLSIEVL